MTLKFGGGGGAGGSGGISPAILQAAGDLIGATAAGAPARVPIGAGGTFLGVDFSKATLLSFQTPPSGSGGGTTIPFTTQGSGGDYTLRLADAGTRVEIYPGNSNLIIPGESVANFAVGTVIELCALGGPVTIQPGLVNVRNPTAFALDGTSQPASWRIRRQGGIVGLTKRGTNDWIVSGDLVP